MPPSVRSPHAHARIGAIGTDRARTMPGVLAVLTGADWRRDGGGDTDVLWDITSHDGTPMALARRPIFAADEARHVGDTVALVVAEDPHAAADAAAAVDVAWEPLPSVTDVAAAVPITLASDFDQLRANVVQLVGTSAPAEGEDGPEIEIDTDYNLRYGNIIRSITAVSGYKDGNQVVKLIEKIKFAKPRR